MIIDALLHNSMTTDDIPLFIKRLNAERAPRNKPIYWPVDSTEPFADEPPTYIPYLPDEEEPDTDDTATPPTAQTAHPVTASGPGPGPVPGTVVVNGAPMPMERKPARAAAPDRENMEQIIRERTRRGKLSRALTLLQSYDNLLDDQAAPTTEERFELATVAALAGRLCERYGIKTDG
jgi:hypothetical protein